MYALLLTSVRCTAFILQYALVYRTSAELKTGDEWTKDLSASFYAISLDYFRTWIGDLLLPHYSLLQMLTYVVLWWELWGPLFLVSPFYTQGSRLIGVLGFMGMHLGFGLSLRLGTFFYVSLAIATALLPPMFWTWFLSYLRTPKRMALKVSYVPSSLFSTTLARLLSIVLIPDTIFAHIQSKLDPESGVPMEVLRSTPLLKCSDYYGTVYTGFEALSFALSHSPLLWPLGWFLSTELATTIAFNPVVLFLFVHFARFVDSDGPPAAVKPNRNPQARVANKLLWFAIKSMFVTICAVTVTAWCLGNIGHTAYKPEFTARGIAYLTHLDQSWGMFAPRPPSSDYYYVFEGQLDDGRMVELFNDRGFKTWNRIRPMRCVRLSSLGGFYVHGGSEARRCWVLRPCAQLGEADERIERSHKPPLVQDIRELQRQRAQPGNSPRVGQVCVPDVEHAPQDHRSRVHLQGVAGERGAPDQRVDREAAQSVAVASYALFQSCAVAELTPLRCRHLL